MLINRSIKSSRRFPNNYDCTNSNKTNNIGTTFSTIFPFHTIILKYFSFLAGSLKSCCLMIERSPVLIQKIIWDSIKTN